MSENLQRRSWICSQSQAAGAARARLQELRERHWIDLQTRELLVYLTVFNPAADLFCNAKLSIKILPSGVRRVVHPHLTAVQPTLRFEKVLYPALQAGPRSHPVSRLSTWCGTC